MSDLNFGREQFAPMAEEVREALAASNFDLQIESYLRLENVGVLRAYTIRDQGRLIAFLIASVGLHMHHRTQLWAFVDLLWVAPDCQSLAWDAPGGAELGLDARLLATAEKQLHREGVLAIQGNATSDGAEA